MGLRWWLISNGSTHKYNAYRKARSKRISPSHLVVVQRVRIRAKGNQGDNS